jgi:hypothetical protein
MARHAPLVTVDLRATWDDLHRPLAAKLAATEKRTATGLRGPISGGIGRGAPTFTSWLAVRF